MLEMQKIANGGLRLTYLLLLISSVPNLIENALDLKEPFCLFLVWQGRRATLARISRNAFIKTSISGDWLVQVDRNKTATYQGTTGKLKKTRNYHGAALIKDAGVGRL